MAQLQVMARYYYFFVKTSVASTNVAFLGAFLLLHAHICLVSLHCTEEKKAIGAAHCSRPEAKGRSRCNKYSSNFFLENKVSQVE